MLSFYPGINTWQGQAKGGAMLTRGTSIFTPLLLSSLAPVFSRYIDLKRALGRRFDIPARTL